MTITCSLFLLPPDGIWDSTGEPEVDDNVSWNGKYKIKFTGEKRKIIGNGLPINHHTGIFPISGNDDAFDYDRNPNSINEIQNWSATRWTVWAFSGVTAKMERN